jgi:hypothetical protein
MSIMPLFIGFRPFFSMDEKPTTKAIMLGYRFSNRLLFLSGHLVAIVLRLVWTFDGNAEVVGLLLGELGQLHADAFEVQAGDFFVDRTNVWPNWAVAELVVTALSQNDG